MSKERIEKKVGIDDIFLATTIVVLLCTLSYFCAWSIERNRNKVFFCNKDMECADLSYGDYTIVVKDFEYVDIASGDNREEATILLKNKAPSRVFLEQLDIDTTKEQLCKTIEECGRAY